jgi:putative transposase
MRTVQTTLTHRDVQSYCHQLLGKHLHLPDYSKKCPFGLLCWVLLYVAAKATTIAQACRSLRGFPCDQTIYDALDATLPGRVELQRRINAALRASLPKSIRQGKKSCAIAIDLFLLPYYGQPDSNKEDRVYKGEEKASTHHHYAYATAYLVRKGRRFTLAMMDVRHDTPWEDIVRTLLRLARKVVPAVRLVLVDRGFYSVAVMRYLQRARTPFIMPVIGRGRSLQHAKGPSGTNAFYGWKKSGWGRYTLRVNTSQRGRGKDERARVDIAVKVRRKWCKRPGSKQKGGRVLVYACWGVRGRDPDWVDQLYKGRRVEWIRQTYHKRFGIETSHRQLNQGRGWTTSRCPVRRLLLVGLALLLRNVWARLHLVVLAERRRGGPRLRRETLYLTEMLDWVADALKELFGVCHEVEAPQPFFL